MNGTHNILLVYGGDASLIDEDIRSKERHANMLLYACKVIGFAIYTEKLSTPK
jgi:hypothetical protein